MSKGRIIKIGTGIVLIMIIYVAVRYMYSFNMIGNPNKEATELLEIPEAYFEPAINQGQVVSLDYQNGSEDKTAYVYLPYGYDSSDVETRYNIFYLMHGGGGSASRYLGGENGDMELKRLLDHMIANGDIEPMIVVTPTFYSNNRSESEGELTARFHSELTNALIPAVENTYHTYAVSTDEAGMRESREHRIFGGFSMGSVTTWYTFINNLDYFKFYLPMSGDSWIQGMLGGLDFSHRRTASELNRIARNSGYGISDYQIYAATGTDDIAYNVLSQQVNAMKRYSDSFVFHEDFTKGNFYFGVLQDGQHDYDAMLVYIYNGLKSFK